MRPGAAGFLADGWRLWRTDWRALTAIAGPFLFLPTLAQNMLIGSGWPSPPEPPKLGVPIDDAVRWRYIESMGDWFGSVGVWVFVSILLAYFAQLAIASFYVARPGNTVGQSLVAAAVRLPLYLVVGIIASVPIGLGYMLLVLPAFFVIGRLALVAPVMMAEPGTGPIAAMTRSIALTRGHSLTMMSVMITVLLGGVLLYLPLASLDDWLVSSAASPVFLVMLDLVIAVTSAAGSLGAILVPVAAYRRLSSS